MQTGEYLGDAPAGGVSPKHDVVQPKLCSQSFDVSNVILHEISALRVPARIAMAAHIDRDYMVVLAEVRREMVESVRDASDSMQQHQRLLAASTPVQVMDTQAVHRDFPVQRLCMCRAKAQREGNHHDLQN